MNPPLRVGTRVGTLIDMSTVKTGTVLVDTDFANRYGIQNATNMTVVGALDAERVEVEWTEFGERCTDVVYIDECTIVDADA